MTKPKLWLGDGVAIDVHNYDDLRMLVQANSGGGKSYELRKILEVTHGEIPHVVLDVEGEFHTLREKFDYVLAGRGGDCPATIQTAALLARRVLEIGFSLIVDISELGTQRELFVKRFLDSLIEAPRELWRPLLVVVDEAHKFCPEAGKSESAEAVKDLMTRGRKRGFCGVLATQRIAKLSKDAAAECVNKLIGRTGLDVDMKRAGDELGFTSKADVLALRKLQPGQFYAFGPALSVEDVTLFRVGKVETTHPKSGQRAIAPAPPKEQVRKLLAKLADLPAEAENEAKSAAELRDQVRKLERELRAAKSAPAAKVEVKVKEVPILTEKLVKDLKTEAGRLQLAVEKAREGCEHVSGELGKVLKALHVAEAWTVNTPPSSKPAAPNGVQHAATSRTTLQPAPARTKAQQYADAAPGAGRPTPAAQRILDAALMLEQLGIPPDVETLAAWTPSHPRSKGFQNNLGALRSAGLMDGVALTQAGRLQANDQTVSIETVMKPLKPKQREILSIVLNERDGPGMTAEELAEQLGNHPRTKSVANNIGALRTRGLLTDGWPIRIGRALEVL